ncbi:class I SAM-dependent methyltransferase [Halostagnicola larsenii]|uniref:class I SAM-dependent methyltransferase n=1 Tax=Halostagnicola larsenii TaxID=353800 RepID=UPI0009FD3E34|nr:class I SAM-dependent methyltransferase [Halostagnicola larsenii]
MSAENLRDCPLCRSSERSLSNQYNGYSIGTCDKCGFLYVFDPGEDTASEANAEIEHARHTKIPEPRKRHQYISNLIEMSCGSNVDVLEIGSGYGGLGKLLEKKDHTYVGFEPSNIRADIATEGGLNVIDKVFEPAEVDQAFDVVVIDNVLEHVLNPLELIIDAASVIKDTGIVIVIVPSRRDLRRLHPNWNDTHFWIPDVHINFFRPMDLNRLYARSGLSMTPFPPSAFEIGTMKDLLFRFKASIEYFDYYPLSLYTYGS